MGNQNQEISYEEKNKRIINDLHNQKDYILVLPNGNFHPYLWVGNKKIPLEVFAKIWNINTFGGIREKDVIEKIGYDPIKVFYTDVEIVHSSSVLLEYTTKQLARRNIYWENKTPGVPLPKGIGTNYANFRILDTSDTLDMEMEESGLIIAKETKNFVSHYKIFPNSRIESLEALFKTAKKILDNPHEDAYCLCCGRKLNIRKDIHLLPRN